MDKKRLENLVARAAGPETDMGQLLRAMVDVLGDNADRLNAIEGKSDMANGGEHIPLEITKAWREAEKCVRCGSVKSVGLVLCQPCWRLNVSAGKGLADFMAPILKGEAHPKGRWT